MNKTIQITGATSGFGRACAERFAGEGWNLVLVGRRTERLNELRDRLDVDVYPLTLDVRQREAVGEAIRGLPAPFEQIDVLVNNAGLALGLEAAPQARLDDWDTMVDTNIKGVLYCTRAVLPQMVKRNCGYVVNIGSIAGDWPYPGGNVYGATKAFVKQFSRNLRADLLGKRIRVTNIEPGIAETEFSVVRFKGDRKKAGDVYRHTRPLRAADIADIVWWVVNTPEHVNINRVEVMSTDQAWGALAVHRETE